MVNLYRDPDNVVHWYLNMRLNVLRASVRRFNRKPKLPYQVGIRRTKTIGDPMNLTKQFLSEKGVVCKRVWLMFNQHETIVTIPHNFILQQRVNSNCSLSEADIVQEVLTVLLGYNSVRDLEEAELDCTAKRTEHGFKYIFRMDN